MMTFTQIKVIKGHNFDVTSITISQDCSIAATGSLDDKIILWNLIHYTKEAEI